MVQLRRESITEEYFIVRLSDKGLVRLVFGPLRLAIVLDDRDAVAVLDIPVLILGETGTGKTRLAHMERDDLSDAAHVMLVNFYMGFMCFGNQTHTLWGSHADRVFTNGALLFLGVAMEAYEASLPEQV